MKGIGRNTMEENFVNSDIQNVVKSKINLDVFNDTS